MLMCVCVCGVSILEDYEGLATSDGNCMVMGKKQSMDKSSLAHKLDSFVVGFN